MKVVLRSPKALSIYMISVVSLVAFVLTVLLVRNSLIHMEGERDAGIKEVFFPNGNRTVMITSRKLLQSDDDGDMNPVGRTCSKDSIVITQGPVAPLPSGIPSYLVEIMNICANDCNIGNIRVHCGWFSSARLINPRVFRRIAYDDCLVNDGQALGPGRAISFQYANTFSYPLSVASVNCFS